MDIDIEEDEFNACWDAFTDEEIQAIDAFKLASFTCTPIITSELPASCGDSTSTTGVQHDSLLKSASTLDIENEHSQHLTSPVVSTLPQELDSTVGDNLAPLKRGRG